MAVAEREGVFRPAAGDARSERDPPPVVHRVLGIGLAVAVAAVLLQTIAHLANALVFDYEYRSLDADMEANVLSWASSAATFAAALAALLLGLLPAAPVRRLLLLGAVLVFFSLDDAVTIHERVAVGLGHRLDLPGSAARSLWPMLLFPLLAFALVTLWRIGAGAPPRIRRTIVAGLALFVLAVVAEVQGTFWGYDDGSRPLADDIEVAVEEGAELGGWILVGSALTALGLVRVATGAPDDADGRETGSARSRPLSA